MLRTSCIADSVQRSAGKSRMLNCGVYYGNLDGLERLAVLHRVVFWVVLQ